MFPNMLCGSCKSLHHQRDLKMTMKPIKPMSNLQCQFPNPFDMDHDDIFIGEVPFKSNKISNKNGGGGIKKMANRFSHLIHRVTTSCLPHPLASAAGGNFSGEEEEDEYNEEEEKEEYSDGGYRTKREIEMVILMSQVFETVSSLKTAYVSLQEAHCPWDADNMRLSDVAVVAEFRKLGILTQRFRRTAGRWSGGGDTKVPSTAMMKEAVAPYEAALRRLKTEVKNKEAEIDSLREKLKTTAAAATVHGGAGRRKSRSQSKRRVSCSGQFQGPPPCASPAAAAMATPDLFEICMNSVKHESKSFASLLLSLMKASDWDITATVRSITATAAVPENTIVGRNHAKYSLESYANRKFFQGFDHETFYMDGSLSSLLNPSQFRSECFTQFSDMKSMDPMELLGILPTCQFGKFCSKKYLSIVHPKMEESLFGDLEQRRQVLAGNHPRSRFYGELLKVAKAVWLLHLVAFSMDPLPSHFEGSRGADFHPEYMESAAGFAGAGDVVGFPVSPGFKLGNGAIVKARVYLVPKSEL